MWISGFIPVRLRPPFDPLEVWLVDDADPDRADEVGPEHRPHHLVRKVGDLANLGILKSILVESRIWSLATSHYKQKTKECFLNE